METVTFFVGVGIFFYVLTCLAIIDVAMKDFGGIEKKAMWGFIAFFPFIGWIIYFAFGYRKGKRKFTEKVEK